MLYCFSFYALNKYLLANICLSSFILPPSFVAWIIDTFIHLTHLEWSEKLSITSHVK
jgi:hypothetical protein